MMRLMDGDDEQRLKKDDDRMIGIFWIFIFYFLSFYSFYSFHFLNHHLF